MSPLMDFLTNFHFLRPALLLLLPFAALSGYVLRAKAQSNNTWDQLLPKEFLHALAPDHHPSQKRNIAPGWPLILMIVIVALAGPAWEKQETPVALKQDPLVIVFDLSLSMLATDQSPNRLTRARQKVYDLLDIRKEGQTGLVVFSGSSHVVSPITEDRNTLKALLPALDPFIMPDFGSNVAAGVQKAVELLDQAGSQEGRILVMADGVEKDDFPEIRKFLRNKPYDFSIIGLGTADGGPIPIPNKGFIKDDDSIVVARPNYDDMRALANQLNGLYSPMTIENGDLKSVLPAVNGIGQIVQDDNGLNTTTEEWHDAGYWLLFLLIPLVLWQYRQMGATLSLALAPLAVMTLMAIPDSAKAFDWIDLWKTKDQQGMELYQLDQFGEAAEKFKDPMWTGTSHYRAGQFEEALAAFSQQDSAASNFNRGNTLVELQRFEEALEAYEKTLQLSPEFEQAAINKKKLEDWLEQQKKEDSEKQQDQTDNQQSENNQNNGEQQDQNQSQQDQNQSQQDDQAQQNQSDSSQQQNSTGEDQQQSASDQQNEKGNNSEDQQARQNTTEEQKSGQEQSESEKQDQQDQTQQLKPSEDKPEDGAEEQAASYADAQSLKDQQTEQWLRRIPDDPGGLLRRKFLQQYQNYGSRDSRREVEGSRTIW